MVYLKNSKTIFFLITQYKKNIVEILTIKSGKKDPQIKKGIIDAIIKFIKTLLDFAKLFIKIKYYINTNLFILNTYYFVLIILKF